MALSSVNPIQTLPFASHRHLRKGDHTHFVVLGFTGPTGVSASRVLKTRVFNVSRWILNATGTRILDTALTQTTGPSSSSTVDIPVTCYQLVGVPDKSEKDEIVKSVMQLKSAEIEEGYTMDAVVSRQDILMDVRDKLLFEAEYAGNVKEKIPPKASLRIPWAWLPGALCLLQEVGEENLVLDIGRAALQHPDAKPHFHDILLSMALAECAIAKIGFEKNKVSHGFEALARAQYLLRSKISLEKMSLLSQIEESLEELAPACTLELLGMPYSPENAERRRGAIAALRELLRQGLDVESSCRVQDWPCFLIQALNRLMATEIVGLLPWDDLALMRKNKKSLESQNQRVVIDFSCFYIALIAYIAFGFSSKQIQMIEKAKIISECLMSSEGIDLKFEEAFCLFLLGQGDEAKAVEKLHQLELNSNPAARSLVSGKELIDGSGVQPSLETWLKGAVLANFSDTRDCSPLLINFFRGDKRTVGIKKHKGPVPNNATVVQRPLPDLALKRMECGDSPFSNASQLAGSAVKKLAPTDLQTPLTLDENGVGSNDTEPSSQLTRDLGVHHQSTISSWLANWDVVGKATFFAVVGCIVLITFKLYYVNPNRRTTLKSGSTRPGVAVSSIVWKGASSPDYGTSKYTMRNGVAGRVEKLLKMVKLHLQNHSELGKPKTSGLAASISSSGLTASRKQMSFNEAEDLVKQWQAIKAEALGPSHQVQSLSEVLDESMLMQWQAVAEAAKSRSCYWKFVLLQMSVLQADLFLDTLGIEVAEIQAQLEEAAELVEESQEKNPAYYSTYKVNYILKRQEDGSWRFCKSDIQPVL